MNIIKKSLYQIKRPWVAYKAKAPMAAFITGRLITMLVLLFLLGFSLFGLMELAPGDIVDQMMSQQIMSSMENSPKKSGSKSEDDLLMNEKQMAQLRAEFGLDKPFYVQYAKWLNRVIVHHDLGTSLISRAPVSFLIRSRIWNSVLLNLISLVFITLFSFVGGVGGTMRMIRATMLDQMGMPYIFALRARGISERRVYLNHAFRNTLNPYITGSANLLASLFSGSLVLEIIFAYPGIGRLMYEAVMQQDINLVLANSMFISALVLIGMIISDILLALVDPRIRYGKE